MTVCKMCGDCCYIRKNGKKKRCPNLTLSKTGRNLCRIYKHRIGRKTVRIDGQQFYCSMREKVEQNYQGCPYNRPEWEMIKDG